MPTAAQIWRDYDVDGDPTSKAHEPAKSEIRAWGAAVETLQNVVLSIAALRAYAVLSAPGALWVVGWNALSTIGGGEFRLKTGSVEADNGVSIIVDAAGRRWERVLNGVADIAMGGALPGVATDQAAKIQAVLDTYSHVRGLPGDWWVNPTRVTTVDGAYALQLNSYQRLVLDEDCAIRALPTAATNYAVVYSAGTTRPRLSGGQIYGERTTHIGTTGEWGHCVDLRGTARGRIESVYVANAWGDGIYLGRGNTATDVNYAARVIDCHVYNCRRNTMSVTHVRRLVVDGCNFEFANGTSPQQGLDIEPDATDTVYDVVVANCTFTGNVNAAFRIEGFASRVQMVTISGCTSRSDSGGALDTEAAFVIKNCDFVTIQACTVARSESHGILVQNASGVVVQGNVISGPRKDGVKLLACDSCVVEANQIDGASRDNANAYSAVFVSGAGPSSAGNIIRSNIGTGATARCGVRINTDATVNEVVTSNRMTGVTSVYDAGGLACQFADNNNRRLILASGAAAVQDATGVDYISGAAATTTTITALNNGHVGQKIAVRGAAGFKLQNNARIALTAGADWAPSSANAVIELVCISGGTAAIYAQAA